MNTQKLEQVPIDKLVPYARNARTHSKEQIAQAIESLGWNPSIRGEALTLEQFAQLADVLLAIK